MASFVFPRRRNSKEQPPVMRSDINQLEKDLFEFFKTDYPQLQQYLDNLLCIFKKFDENVKKATKGSRDGQIAGISGGVLIVLGAAFAPFTLGLSALIAGAGATVVTGGAIGQGVWNKKKKSTQIQFKPDLEDALKEFQNKITPMRYKIKDINQRLEEILRDIKNPANYVSYSSKYLASWSELLCFIRKYEIGGLAATISETLHLSENITGTVFRIRSVLERVSIGVESEAHKDMRKEFNMLQTFMEHIRTTKDIIIDQ